VWTGIIKSQTSPGSHGQGLYPCHKHVLIVIVNSSLASPFPCCSEEELLKMSSHSFNIIPPPQPSTVFLTIFFSLLLPSFCYHHNGEINISSCCTEVMSGKAGFVLSCMLTPKLLAVLSLNKFYKMLQKNNLLVTHQQVDNYCLSRELFSKFFMLLYSSPILVSYFAYL